MEKAYLKLVLLLVLPLLCALNSCKGDEPDGPGTPTAEQKAIEDLTNNSSLTWTVANGGSVEKDGVAQTSDFQDFELWLSSNNNTYTTTTPNPIFDQSGNWSFVGDNYDKIQLSGNQIAAGKEISFTRNQDNLRLEFSVPLPNARTEALAGNYVFNLKRKD